MDKTTYEINVAYKGLHDFTVTVGKNGPYNPSVMTAKAVLRALREGLLSDEDYDVSMQEVKHTTKRSSI